MKNKNFDHVILLLLLLYTQRDAHARFAFQNARSLSSINQSHKQALIIEAREEQEDSRVSAKPPQSEKMEEKRKEKEMEGGKKAKALQPLAKIHYLSFFPPQSAREGRRRGISNRKKEQGKRHTRVTYWRKRVVGTKRHPRPSAIENGTRRRGDVVRYVLLELGIELFKSTSGEVVEKREKGKGPDSIVIA